MNYTVNHPALKSLFAAIGKPLPSETEASASVAQRASRKRRIFENYFGTKKICLTVDEAEWISKYRLMYLWAAWIPQIKHFLLIAFHLKAVAMSIAVLFDTMLMTYCDNLGPKEKILHCF